MKMRFLTLTFILILLNALSLHADKKKALRISPLSIKESYTVPAQEISGLAWRTNPKTKRQELIVVGDREHKIYIIDWENRKTNFSVQEIDLTPLEKTSQSEQSEWESVYSDETGRIFIIKENPSQIQIISPDFKRVISTIDLTMPGFSKKNDKDNNSGGEGILPLKNGHFLVVKEKNPLRIIEFAPEGKKAEGYRTKDSIERKGRFPIPSGKVSKYQPVNTWKLSFDAESLLEDSSGLNTDPKGKLYLLGDQRNMIAKIDKKLKPKKETIKVSKVWSLPSKIKQPEGMVIDDDYHPIIAVDTKKTDAPNLFILSPVK